METKVQKWGNSLGIRIPNFLVKELHLKNASTVDLKREDNKLIITLSKKVKLKNLMSTINEDNIHKEIETGNTLGNEIW